MGPAVPTGRWIECIPTHVDRSTGTPIALPIRYILFECRSGNGEDPAGVRPGRPWGLPVYVQQT